MFITDTKPFHATIKHDFDDAAIHKVTYNFANPSSGIAAADGNVAYTLCQTTNEIHKLKLPEEAPKKVGI